MKIVNSGKMYMLYDSDTQILSDFPVKTYSARFSKNTGFYLEEHPQLEIREEKIYGCHLSKVNKTLQTFEKMSRNLGIILSGDKGIGKSIFARILSVESIKRGIPVIIVDTYYPGIASFLEKINQEVMILFDEFDKTFGKSENDDPQAEMLSLFDGIAVGKKMFVVTCNELRNLNEFLVNRPGRFHYHLRFDYPAPDEIREYLKDKLEEQFYGEIDKVITFSRKVNLNFDCLRSIAFELNLGEPFETAILDMNIVNVELENYNITLSFKDGTMENRKDFRLDMFSSEQESVWIGNYRVTFTPSDAAYDMYTGASVIDGSDIELSFDEDEDGDQSKKNLVPEKLIFRRKEGKKLHYAV